MSNLDECPVFGTYHRNSYLFSEDHPSLRPYRKDTSWDAVIFVSLLWHTHAAQFNHRTMIELLRSSLLISQTLSWARVSDWVIRRSKRGVDVDLGWGLFVTSDSQSWSPSIFFNIYWVKKNEKCRVFFLVTIFCFFMGYLLLGSAMYFFNKCSFMNKCTFLLRSFKNIFWTSWEKISKMYNFFLNEFLPQFHLYF